MSDALGAEHVDGLGDRRGIRCFTRVDDAMDAGVGRERERCFEARSRRT